MYVCTQTILGGGAVEEPLVNQIWLGQKRVLYMRMYSNDLVGAAVQEPLVTVRFDLAKKWNSAPIHANPSNSTPSFPLIICLFWLLCVLYCLLTGGLGNALFVSGMPGSGKTATANEVGCILYTVLVFVWMVAS